MIAYIAHVGKCNDLSYIMNVNEIGWNCMIHTCMCCYFPHWRWWEVVFAVVGMQILDKWHSCLLIYWRTSCLLPAFDDSVTCLRLSDASVICLVTYFSVSNSVCFSCMSAARQLQRRTWFIQYRTSDVAENVGSTFLVCGVQPRVNDLELILTVTVKTRHPVEDYFGSEFLAICTHCGVMVAWSGKTWKLVE